MSTSSSRPISSSSRRRATRPKSRLGASVLVVVLLFAGMMLETVLSETAATATAAAPETRVIKLASLIPSGSFWDRALKTMGAAWRTGTSGRVQLRIYSGGVAGDDPDVLRKMRIGQLHAGTVTVSGLSDIDSAFALFEIPMFFDSYEEFFHVLEEMSPELEARLEAKGYILLHWAHAGWIYFFTTEPVDSFDELRELEVFQWAGDARMEALWRKHGFRPVPLAGTDIPMGLQSGMFKTLPATPMAALSLQWFRSASNMIDLRLAPLIGATLVDERVWSKLAQEDRRTVRAAGREAGELFRDEIAAQDAKAVQEMQERGLKVHVVVGTHREAAWRQAALAFADDMRATFVPTDVYDRALGIRDAYRAGSKTGDSE